MDNEQLSNRKRTLIVFKYRPHVVVLGAGASRATCPYGDKNNKKLPLMQDFTQILEIEYLLEEWGIDPHQNFEEIFSDLFESGETKKQEKLQEKIKDYFKELELPEKPTIYDHLVLSLRGQDLIATFNWDPLLLQAYCRNGNCGLELPKLAFLHGNISVGFCKTDGTSGLLMKRCSKCKQPFQHTPLLYPIKKKNYTENMFISREWRQLQDRFKNAIMITIFGYSGPKTDVEAISAMKNAWGKKKYRRFEETCFISNKSENKISKNWKYFIHTHHYSVYSNFYESFIANHPRRTQEAHFKEKLEAKFIIDNPIPQDYSFPELWEWFSQFKDSENYSNPLKTFDDVSIESFK
jgi:hypothetical protein